jgi:hypothetical protein
VGNPADLFLLDSQKGSAYHNTEEKIRKSCRERFDHTTGIQILQEK